MENENKQHVQLPTDNENESELEPKDLLIYLAIKRHQNKDTKEAYPSLDKISEESGASVPTVRKIIKKLIDTGYISYRVSGRKHIYSFNPYKYFEPFSYEFLDNKDMSFTDKSYLVAAQKYMIKENGYGKMTLTNRELSQKIHMSESTISKVQRSLEAKNILLTIDTKMRDPETGLVKKEKIFDLSAYGQAIVFILKNHDERIADAEEDIVSLKKDMEMMKQEIMRLKKQEQKKDNTKVVL